MGLSETRPLIMAYRSIGKALPCSGGQGGEESDSVKKRKAHGVRAKGGARGNS